MTVRFIAELELHGFPDWDNERIVAATEVAIRQALQPFKSPLQPDQLTLTLEPVRKGIASETAPLARKAVV